MDDRNGRLYTEAEARELMRRDSEARSHLKQVIPNARQLGRRPPKIGRNDPCPCGSGKKFKKCCLFAGGTGS